MYSVQVWNLRRDRAAKSLPPESVTVFDCLACGSSFEPSLDGVCLHCGENVSPAEIEARLMTLVGVGAVAIVGYPDPRLHEVAVAYIVHSAEGQLTEEDVLDSLRGEVASFKITRHDLFVDEFPMTPSGKVQKVKLRADALEKLGDPNQVAAS